MNSSRQAALFAKGVAVVTAIVVIRACMADRDEARQSEPDTLRVERALEPTPDAASTPPREGIAAVVLMDVSGSMDEEIRGSEEPKIAVARRAAVDLVSQFDAYADAHPDEPVLVGLFEFSGRAGASTREVIPLSRPDPEAAQRAVGKMYADGGTPIGDAMIVGKQALDRSGLSRRHLLVVTDGENTDGFAPSDVMNALSSRPEIERPSVYFVAFNISANRFDRVRSAGALVLEAANAQELNQTLDSLLSGKILVEQ